MSTSENPFIPGARVAIRRGYVDGNYIEDFVDKVHKTGRFTLRGSPKQQWKPSSWRGFGDDDKPAWVAHPSGKGWGYSRMQVKIWDASTDAEISEVVAKAARCARFDKLSVRIRALRSDDLTDNMLDKIEAALS